VAQSFGRGEVKQMREAGDFKIKVIDSRRTRIGAGQIPDH
jgi:hypothetical protein